MNKILHIGDEHFGDSEMLEDILKSSVFIIEKAREETPDLIISSGDLLDSRLPHDSPGLKHALEFVKGLASIAPVFILKGTTSHDGRSLRFLESLQTKNKIYVSEAIEEVGLKDGEFFSVEDYEEGLDALIYSLPPVSKANITNESLNEADKVVSDLLRNIFMMWGEISERAKADGVTTILISHGTVTGATTSTGAKMAGKDIEFGTGDLALAKADLVCLGHIHKSQSWGNIFYPGSIARLNIGEVEEKGFWVHEKNENGFKSRFVIIPTRAIIPIEFDGLPEIENLPVEITPGALVRVIYRVPEEDVHSYNEESLRNHILSLGASEVRIEKTVIPLQTVRAEGISRLQSLEDKFRKWAETSGIEVTESIIEKIKLIQNPLDIVYSELGLTIPTNTKRRRKR